MPRNTTTQVATAARRAQANFEAAGDAYDHASAERKTSMVLCYQQTDLSVYDIAEIFATSPSYVHNVLRAAGVERRRSA